jgi:hypothetical protein
MARIDGLFLRIAVVYMLVGMALGIVMAMSEDHSQMPTHAHINLAGWASMALFAIAYRTWPEAAASRLAWWHFWLANIGTLALVAGVAGIMLGHPGAEPIAAAGSLVMLLSFMLFAAIVFRHIPMFGPMFGSSADRREGIDSASLRQAR